MKVAFSRRLLAPLAGALLSLLLPGLGIRAGLEEARNSTPARLGPVIARVDGVPIYLGQARARLQGLLAAHRPSGGEGGAARWKPLVLRSLVDDVVVLEAAREMGVLPSQGEVRKAVQGLKGRLGGAAAFRRWLREQGMDEWELARRVRLQMAAAAVYLKVTEKVAVTDPEVEAYYRDHLEEFTVDGKPRPLLEVRAAIEDELLKEKKDRTYSRWLEERRRSVKVEVISKEWEE